tara:strand:+ start:129 stop:302 length:174 start_codon:yes stop_codon:yes gene_type:complete
MKNKDIYFTGNKKQNLLDKSKYIKKQREELSSCLTFLKNSNYNTNFYISLKKILESY